MVYTQHGMRLASPAAPEPTVAPQLEEFLVVDSRAGLTPAEMVERKLRALLPGPAVVARRAEMHVPRAPQGTAAWTRRSHERGPMVSAV